MKNGKERKERVWKRSKTGKRKKKEKGKKRDHKQYFRIKRIIENKRGDNRGEKYWCSKIHIWGHSFTSPWFKFYLILFQRFEEAIQIP